MRWSSGWPRRWCSWPPSRCGRLHLLDQPAELVLGGGVLAARDPLLLGSVEAKVHERAPQVEIRVVDRPPVVGAALLGMDALGASPTAEARLREALLERTGASRPAGLVE